MKIQMMLSCFIALFMIINAQKFPNMPKQRVILDKPHHHATPEERRKHSLFPKMTKKFVVTMNPDEESYVPQMTTRMTTTTPKPVKNKIASQKMFKATTNPAPTKHIPTKQAPTKFAPAKPALIQPRRFVYKPKPEVKEEFDEIQEEVNESQQDIENEEQEMNEPEEENITDDEVSEEQAELVDEEGFENEDKPYKREATVKIMQKRSYFSIPIVKKHDSSSEESDENEFIFLKNKDLLTKTKEDEEITTEYVTEIPRRIKRKDNIIEEENLGATISGYKYTGRISHQSNHLVFKNINT